MDLSLKKKALDLEPQDPVVQRGDKFISRIVLTQG